MYDLYFPPNVSIGSQVSKAVIFYPDLFINKTAYTSVMSALSDVGVLVLVVNLDPLRIPMHMNGGSRKGSASTTVLKITFEIGKLLGIQVEEWIMMSHGEGMCAVTDVIRNSIAGSKRKPKCILWSPTSFFHDLRKVHASVLVVSASASTGAKRSNADHILKKRLPDDSTIIHNISGGSHSGFAHYGPGTCRKEMIRTKSLDEQQKEARERTIDFIFQREPSLGKSD